MLVVRSSAECSFCAAGSEGGEWNSVGWGLEREGHAAKPLGNVAEVGGTYKLMRAAEVKETLMW